MTTELVPNSDMQMFSPAEIKRAGELLRCPLDESSAIKALIIQRDTGLSLTRGEISIVPFNGRPTVMINKQGYLAYAARQPNYDGYESGTATEDNEIVAWCTVYNKDISHPVKVKIYQKEYAKTTPIWKEKPRYMLEKTAISLALRAAFPILNGTYEEDEIEADAQPVKIAPMPTDLTVEPAQPTTEPAPKTEPVANVQRPRPTNLYTADQVAMQILPTYQQQGWDTSIFEKAKLPDGFYDKDMIMEDYKIQMDIPNSEVPPMKTQAKPSDGVSDVVCEKCGKKLLKSDIEKSKLYGKGHTLCETCLQDFVAESIKAKQSKPETTEDEHVCPSCGKIMSKTEYNSMKLFASGGKVLCKDCSVKQEKALE